MNPLYPKARVYFCVAAISAAVLCPQPLFAWSGNGHCIVGQIAQDLLQQDNDPRSKVALGQIAQILGVSQLSPTALSQLAPCADEIRSVDEETGVAKAAGGTVKCGGLTLAMNPASEPWHFINFPINSGESWQSACPGNSCVVGQIIEDVQGLQGNDPPSKRQTDLMYLVHFAGDVHQPLHCAYTVLATGEKDMGGNCEWVKPSTGAKLKWHAYWDHQLNSTIPNDCQSLAKTLEAQASIDGGTDPAAIASQAAQESLDAANTLYQDIEGLGNQAGVWKEQTCKKSPVPPAIPLSSDYESANEHIVTERLTTAGGRLAALLKIALGSQSSSPSAPSTPAAGEKPRRHRTTDAAPAAALDASPNSNGVENVLQQQ